jgi:tellurite resistance protein TerC
MSFNPLLLIGSAWGADGAATNAATSVDLNSYCTPDVPLGFPTETVAIFLGAFVFSLIIDLMQHKNSKEITFASSVIWSIFWILLSLGFYGWVMYHHGSTCGSLFLTGYVLEKTLSVDNLMIFIAIFKFFNIRDVLQHKILYWGILGAIVFRGVFVGLGSLLLMFEGIAYIVFGLLVGYAAIMMLGGEDDDDDEDPDYEDMWLVKMFNKVYPIFPSLVADRFFVNKQEVEEAKTKDPDLQDFEVKSDVTKWMTPAFVCLLVIEGSDVLFAVDSVPAVIAVTKEPLLVYSSMIFAILGLRSLYFVLVVLTKYLVYLEKAVVFVLFFIAFKMFLHAYEHYSPGTSLPHVPEWLDITPNVSMAVVLGLLTIGIVASLIFPGEDDEEEEAA